MVQNLVKERPSVYKGEEIYESLLRKFQQEREEQQDDVTRKQLNYFRAEIESFRNDLTEIHYDKPNRTDRLIKAIQDYDTKYDGLLKGLDESFMLFVVGTGKYGKSTLINALLESEAAEVGVLPKTWKIDIFRKDLPANKVVIKYRSNKEVQVSVKKAKEMIEVEEKKRKDSEAIVNAKLTKLKKEVSSFEAFKDLKLKLEREEIYNSDIVEVHWGMKSSPILEDFYVVDTPGLTQIVMGEVRNNVQDYYHKADGVLWMLDATAIAASNAKKLVEDLEESLANVGGKQQQNIIAVLNRVDLIYKQQGADGVKRVLADAEAIYKGYFRAIIPFSALQAFQGAMTKDQELLEISGMNRLYSEIQQAFYKNAKQIQYNKKLESCYAYNKEVSKLIAEYQQQLESDVEKLIDEEEKIDQHLEKESKKLQKNSKALLDSYQKRVKENIRVKAETFIDLKDKDAQKRFVDKEIFETARLSGLLQDFQKEVKQEYTNISGLYKKKIYFTEYPNLQQQTSLVLQNEIGVNVNLFRDSSGESFVTIGSGVAAGLVAAMFLGPLGLVVGGIVSWFAKNSMRDKVRRSLHEELDKIYIDLSTKISDSIEAYADNAYEEIIYSSAVMSFSEVYSFTESISDLDDLSDAVNSLLEDSKNLKETLQKPSPNFYTPLKELLFAK